MKKTILYSLTALMCLVILLSSCSKEQEIIVPVNNNNSNLISSLENINMSYGINPDDSIEESEDNSRKSKKLKWWKIIHQIH